MKTKSSYILIICLLVTLYTTAQNKHSKESKFPNYKGLVMAGYQGWFREPKEGIMYPDENKMRIDMWPDVSEYQKTYPTGLKLADGKTARFFRYYLQYLIYFVIFYTLVTPRGSFLR